MPTTVTVLTVLPGDDHVVIHLATVVRDGVDYVLPDATEYGRV